MCSSDIFLAVLAVFFPPIAVWIKRGICTADSVINFTLLLLGYIPGLIHAWYIIVQYPDPDYDDPAYAPIPGNAGDDAENGRVTYYYVSHQPSQRSYGTNDQQPRAPQGPQAGAAGSSQGQSEARSPPTYAEAVQGDHKIQTQ